MTAMDTADSVAFVALANRLADAAGVVIRRYFRADVAVESKADESPVTVADREAEQAMRALIEAAFPEHGIFGEEFPVKPAQGPWTWYLDPIDGTKSFISGIPLFGTLIALVRDCRPVLGLMDQPVSGERWLAAPGGGVTLNGKAIRARRCPSLGEASLFTTGLEYFGAAGAEAFRRLSAEVRLTRFGADCYAAGMLAAGFIDIMVEANVKEFDVAALVPIVEAAGGVMTDWQGRPLVFDGAPEVPTMIACGDPALLEPALRLLSS